MSDGNSPKPRPVLVTGGAGLTVQNTHFGIRDAFTYVIMVARKS